MTINSGYLELPITTDQDTMTQAALQKIASALPGWQPREGNLEVLLLEQFAEMAAEAAQVASQVPLEVFAYYGSLVGVTQNPGVPMEILTTWTLASPSGPSVTIPAGTGASITIGNVNYTFTVKEDFTIATSPGYADGVAMVAAASGVSYNSVPVDSYLTPVYSFSNISTVQIDSVTTAGVDTESVSTYLNRLSNTLATYSPRPITANDYATLSQLVNNVNRVTAIDEVNPFVNLLSPAQAIPSAGGWAPLGGTTTLVDSTARSALEVTASGSALPSFDGDIGAADGFIPFYSTTTSGAVTSDAIPLTADSEFLVPGFGYIVTTNQKVIGFSHGGSDSGTLIDVVFSTPGETYPASGALVFSAGPTAWWDSTPLTPVASDLYAGTGLGIALTGVSAMEPIVLSGVKAVVVSTLVTKVGFSTSPFHENYSGDSTTLTISPGVTTGAVNISSNGCNILGMANVRADDTDTNSVPVITAVVQYQDSDAYYAYYSDPTYSDSFDSVSQNLSLLISGQCPDAFSPLLLDDPLFSSAGHSYHPNVSKVTLNVFWINLAASHVEYVELAALRLTNDNVAYVKDGVWMTNGSAAGTTGHPGSVIPDGLFDSVFTYDAPTTKWGGTGTPALSSLSGNLLLVSGAGAAPAGAGFIVSTIGNVHYFTHTGISGTTLTGCTFTGSGAELISPSSQIVLFTGSADPLMWTFSEPTGSGEFAALPGLGVRFTPSAEPTTDLAIATSSAFQLTSGIDYVLDLEIDTTNFVSGTTPQLTLVQVGGSGFLSQNLDSFLGARGRITTIVTPSTNHDAVLELVFPSGMSASGPITITNMSLTPLIGVLANLDVASPNYQYWLDTLGPTSPGPTWVPTGPGPNWGLGNPIVSGYPRNVTVVAGDVDGLYPGLSTIQSTERYLQSYREINFGANVIGPAYALINISYSVIIARGYDAATVQASIIEKLTSLISPYNWATNNSGSEIWDSSQTLLRYLDVVGLIDDAVGVANIVDVTTGLYGHALGRVDIDFGGDGILPPPNIGTLPILATVTANIVQNNATVFELSNQQNY